MSSKSTDVEHNHKAFYCEWNPRLDNVLARLEEKGDNNRILRMVLKGTGKFHCELIKLRKLKYFRNSFSKLTDPIRFNYTPIDFRDSKAKEPIPIEVIREEFDYAMNDGFDETAETVIVEEIIWLDNHDYKDWNNLSRKRWMGLMDRKEIIIKGEDRKMIPDLEESGTYRPLVMVAAERFDLFRNDVNRIKRKNMRVADLLVFDDPSNFFPNLWVDSGDIEAFVIDPVSKQAVKDTIPIKIRYNGHVVQF